MNEPISKEQAVELMNHRTEGCVSLYMPGHPAGAEVRQDPIRLKTLLKNARAKLQELGFAGGDIDRQLKPLADLGNDGEFLRNPGNGVAAFASPQGHWILRLPMDVEPAVTVSDRFCLKPLLEFLTDDAEVFLLAISGTSVRLFRANRHDIEEIEMPNIPHSLAEAMVWDDPEKHLEFHTAQEHHQPGQRKPVAFHGQGTGSDDTLDKKKITEYLHMVDEGVQRVLRKQKAPLVIAAAEPMASLARQATHYSPVHEELIHGHPDRVSAEEFHKQLLPLLHKQVEERLQRDSDLLHQAMNADLGSVSLDEVLTAAQNSRVDTLFVARDQQCWGKFDLESGQMERHDEAKPGDTDLLDPAAVGTYLHGGTVHLVPREKMPVDAPVAAKYRYAISAVNK
ncbi:MAG: hypothetical protein ACLFV7_00205 [Phycisphaerae bacterium]